MKIGHTGKIRSEIENKLGRTLSKEEWSDWHTEMENIKSRKATKREKIPLLQKMNFVKLQMMHLDFGELTVILWKNAKGKPREIFRGDYMLQIYLLTDKYNKTFNDLNILYKDIN